MVTVNSQFNTQQLQNADYLDFSVQTEFSGSLRTIYEISQGFVSVTFESIKIVALSIMDVVIVILMCPVYLLAPPANHVFSAKLIEITYTYVTIPTVFFRELLTVCLPKLEVTFNHGVRGKLDYSMLIAVGISEELVFRGLIQTVLLKELPKAALRKVAPDYEECIDYNTVKVARVILAASIFAIAHAHAIRNTPGLVIPQFINGVLYGIAKEKGQSLGKIAAVHALYDAWILTLLGGFDLQSPPFNPH